MIWICLFLLPSILKYGSRMLYDYYYNNKVLAKRSFVYDPDADPDYRRAAFIEGQVSQGLSRERAVRYADHMRL